MEKRDYFGKIQSKRLQSKISQPDLVDVLSIFLNHLIPFSVFFSRLNRANQAISALIAVTQKGLTAQKAKSVQRPISCARQLGYWEEKMQSQMIFDALYLVYRQA